MLVSGYYNNPIKFEVADQELLKGLIASFSLKDVFDPCNDSYWKEIYDDSNNLVSLDKYTDVSYHGSPSYQATGARITDQYNLRAYKALKELKILLEIKNNDRDWDIK